MVAIKTFCKELDLESWFLSNLQLDKTTKDEIEKLFTESKQLKDKFKVSKKNTCLIKEPYAAPYEGEILEEKEFTFVVKVNDRLLEYDKTVVQPNSTINNWENFHEEKESRRKKGLGSGSIYYRKHKTKNVIQAFFDYEIWSDGKCLKRGTEYIPRKLEKKIEQLNRKKASISEILWILQNRKKKKKK